MEKEHKNIELRSEEVQEVMGEIPHWILRWGITILSIIVLVLLIGSCFFKYPDVIASDMTLTGRYPVAQIVARSSGKIKQLYIQDGQIVAINEPLAIIDNPASTDDMFSLRKRILQYINDPKTFLEESRNMNTEFALGEVQTFYTTFLNNLNEYENYHTINYYPKKIAATREQISKYKLSYQSRKRQQEVQLAQFQLAEQQYSRDSLLHSRGVISPSEHETAKASYLQNRHTLESGYIALEDLQIRIGELEVNLLDMELQQAEKENQLLQNYRANVEQLVNAINTWELNYCLSAPIDGKVTFTKYWNENQYISAGDNVFTIIPDKKDELIGKALLPIQRSGKVKIGQRVIIRFANYPDQEFGIVDGVVKSISLVPSEEKYQVEVNLPNGLMTNYKKTLPVNFEMKASAEIITEDMTLIERFFMPLRKVLKEGFHNKGEL